MGEEKAMGIDVDSKELECCLVIDEDKKNATWKRIKNQKKAMVELLKWIKKEGVRRVVLEASGGYERKVAEYLSANGVATYKVNPRQARDFANGIGFLEKTDRIDAFVLGRFAQVAKLPPPVNGTKQSFKLKQLVVRRNQLKDNIQVEKNRKRLSEKEAKESIVRHIEFLEKEKELVEQQIKDVIESDKEMLFRLNALIKIKGIAFITAAALVALMPELGYLSRTQVAKLAGLAPLCRDSGKKNGKRSIFGGRSHVRKALYMPAWSTVRWDPLMKQFYAKLHVEKGKLKKVAITAVMRKLIVRANAIIRDCLKEREELQN